MDEIRFHEPLDSKQVRRVAVVKVFRRLFLQIEGKMVVLATREVMDLVPYSPEKVTGAQKNGVLAMGNDTGRNKIGKRRNPEAHEGYPQWSVKISQSPCPFFYVRFPQIDGTTVFLASRVPFRDFFGDKRRGLPEKYIALHG